MSSKENRAYLRDMLESIDNITAFIGEADFLAFAADTKTRSAVERQLQIVTEAAFRLGDDAERLLPGADLKGMRGMGNLLRHAYDHVDGKVVWTTVVDNLPPLRVAVLDALALTQSEVKETQTTTL